MTLLVNSCRLYMLDDETELAWNCFHIIYFISQILIWLMLYLFKQYILYFKVLLYFKVHCFLCTSADCSLLVCWCHVLPDWSTHQAASSCSLNEQTNHPQSRKGRHNLPTWITTKSLWRWPSHHMDWTISDNLLKG